MMMRDIVRDIARQHGLEPQALIKKDKRPQIAKARIQAMLALRDAGFRKSAIGRALHRHRSTIFDCLDRYG